MLEFLFNKVSGLKACNFINKRLQQSNSGRLSLIQHYLRKKKTQQNKPNFDDCSTSTVVLCKVQKHLFTGVLWKSCSEEFCKIHWNHLCPIVSLKSCRPSAWNFILKETPSTDVFLWIFRIFLEKTFGRTSLDGYFWKQLSQYFKKN